MIFVQESRTSSDNLNDCLGLPEPNKHTECFFFNVDFHLGISSYINMCQTSIHHLQGSFIQLWNMVFCALS